MQLKSQASEVSQADWQVAVFNLELPRRTWSLLDRFRMNTGQNWCLTSQTSANVVSGRR